MFAVFALGFCVSAAHAQTPPPTSIEIGDVDGDSQPDLLVYDTTHEHPELDLIMSQSNESTRVVTLGDNETVLWETCQIVDELGWHGSRGILIGTTEETSESGWITKFRVLDSSSLLLLGQAVGIQEPAEIESVWLVQWRGDTVPDGLIDVLDLTDALSSAPFFINEYDVQHRALVGAADINIDGVLSADEFIELTFSLDESDIPSHHVVEVAAWRNKVTKWIHDWWFGCAACSRDCGALMVELRDAVNEFNENWRENCAPHEDDPGSEEYIQCLINREAAYAHVADIARRAAANCMCIFDCAEIAMGV